ncbi:MAG: AAA family ATPase [Armatimonadetes bacterium]|nr:AAA family ATPase [Armatimonadota bacterium]
MLIVFGGLPGVGKTTIARQLAQQLGATLIRIDSIEQAIIRSGLITGDIGPAGYCAAYEIAKDNLVLGRTVIADSVNPIAITREAWKAVATEAGVPCIEVEIVCSDASQHKQRVETRKADIEGHKLPDWEAVANREYEPLPTADLRIDTATCSPEAAVNRIGALVTKIRLSN